jgi:hypothetical protein
MGRVKQLARRLAITGTTAAVLSAGLVVPASPAFAAQECAGSIDWHAGGAYTYCWQYDGALYFRIRIYCQLANNLRAWYYGSWQPVGGGSASGRWCKPNELILSYTTQGLWG